VVAADINKSGGLSSYTGSEEWSVLQYTGGGNIGLRTLRTMPILADSVDLLEMTITGPDGSHTMGEVRAL
jgi:hypothetical protein